MLRSSLLCIVGALIGAGAAGYLAHNHYEKKILDVRLDAEEQTRRQLKQGTINVEALQNQVQQLQSQHVRDQATVTELQRELQKAHDALRFSTESLAFYESMDKASAGAAVSLRNVAYRRLNASQIQYKLLLSTSPESQSDFEGQLEFLAEGMLNGSSCELPLAAAGSDSAAPDAASDQASDCEALKKHQKELVSAQDALAVQIRYLKVLEGLLDVPVGFEPQTMTLNIISRGKVVLSRKVKLNS